MRQPQAPLQAVAEHPPALAPGTLLCGRYWIEGYIGGGGFAHIYQARDTILGHRRAIKEAFYYDPYTQQQFRLEAEFLLNARHPNLVRGYATFEHLGRFYLVMDHVDGHTLEEIAIRHIRHTGRPIAEAQILDWMLPICDAVHALHEQPTPIIHRDVKPANIKLTHIGRPVLIDLGLAKLYNPGAQTIGAALAFTPGYAPPEQYQASGATDRRTDVYGLGATLYFLLTGYQPLEAPARLAAHALPALHALNPALSMAAEAAVLKAMALDPAVRQQNALLLLDDLRSARLALAATSASPGAAPDGAGLARGAPSCPRCGADNPAAARFCMRCGGPLLLPDTAFDGVPRVPAARPVDPDDASQPAHAEPALAQNRAPAPIAPGVPVDEAQPSPQQDAVALAAAGPRRVPVSPPQRSPAADAISRALLGRPPAEPDEATAAIFAILALALFSLSALAVFHGWTLIFVAPALALSVLSLVRQSAATPYEFKVLAAGALVLTCLWPLVWFLLVHAPRL
jgi:Protein kinase domain/zinc-ribbon domain